jgi:ABC-2 type transport system ATP-binding protein
VLEIHVETDADLTAAEALLGADEAVVVDAAGRQLDLAITTGASQSLGLLRRLEDGGVTIGDFQLRRPTLDDVFLSLTGVRPTEEIGVSQ